MNLIEINKELNKLNLTVYRYLIDKLHIRIHTSYLKGDYGVYYGILLQNNKEFKVVAKSFKREITFLKID